MPVLLGRASGAAPTGCAHLALARRPQAASLSARTTLVRASHLRLLRTPTLLPPARPSRPARTRTAMISPAKPFHTIPRNVTDSVCPTLTAERVQVPWITALEQKRAQDKASAAGQKAEIDRDARDARMRVPKRMADSYHRVILPLAQDPWLSDTYLNASGHIRLGALFMDIDALAGVICYKHTGGDSSIANVTAAFDRITIKNPIKQIHDLELSGQVTYASGRSSMEISLQVARLAPPDEHGNRPDPTAEDVLLESTCTMVSLDAETRRPANVHPLLIETDEERIISERGAANAERKKTLRATDLAKYTPNAEETELIHRIWMKQMELMSTKQETESTQAALPITFHLSTVPSSAAPKPNDKGEVPGALAPAGNIHFMDSTKLHKASIMQPQYRNRHHFMVFGGYLLKETFELAFCCAASFARARPSFISLDPSTFRNSVPIGSVLYLTARVAYTDPQVVPDLECDEAAEEAGYSSSSGSSTMSTPTLTGPSGAEAEVGWEAARRGRRRRWSVRTRVQVRVDSVGRDIEHGGEAKPMGTFNYTFVVEKDIRVLPQTYSEYMMYLDARRRAKLADEHAVQLRGEEVLLQQHQRAKRAAAEKAGEAGEAGEAGDGGDGPVLVESAPALADVFEPGPKAPPSGPTGRQQRRGMHSSSSGSSGNGSDVRSPPAEIELAPPPERAFVRRRSLQPLGGAEVTAKVRKMRSDSITE